jgi:hypothetical protein
MQNITPEDIDNIIKTYQYRYVSLTNAKNKFGGYNKTPKDLKSKIDAIRKLLVNLPNDVYYFNFKMTPAGDTFTYTYNKGNILSEAMPSVTPFVMPSTPLEKFQTLDEWKKQEQLINELRQEIAMLKMAKQFETLKEPEPEPVNPVMGFAQNVLPMFMPLAEKYFAQKDRELSIKEKAAAAAKPIVKKVITKYRPLPNVNDPNINNYINYFDTLSDAQAEQELNFVQTNNPELYQYLSETFYPDENETN